MRILEKVDLKLEEGRVYLLVGKNGSGKTTLLKILSGLLSPTEGDVLLDGRRVDSEELLQISGYVFQNPQTQVIGATVEEDVAFGLENLGIEREEMIKRVEEVLKELDLYDIRCFDPVLLSGGQLQRLAIASIVALRPKLLLLDEPLSMLDRDGVEEVLRVIEKVSKDRIVVIATHDPQLFRFADEVILLEGGKVKGIHGTGEFDIRMISNA